MAWKEAADYIRENADKIKYSRTPIIDLDSRKEKEKYRAHKQSKRNKKTIKEYIDWNHGETFENNPITISRDHYRLVQIRRYINTARKRRAAVRNQRGLSGKIASTLGKWRTRQLENSLKKLQEAADNNDMRPIWQYRRKIRMTNTNSQAIIKKKDGTDCQRIEETIKRWEERARENFSKERKELIPKISRITEQGWGKNFIEPAEDIQQIRVRELNTNENDEKTPGNRRMAEQTI